MLDDRTFIYFIIFLFAFFKVLSIVSIAYIFKLNKKYSIEINKLQDENKSNYRELILMRNICNSNFELISYLGNGLKNFNNNPLTNFSDLNNIGLILEKYANEKKFLDKEEKLLVIRFLKEYFKDYCYKNKSIEKLKLKEFELVMKK